MFKTLVVGALLASSARRVVSTGNNSTDDWGDVVTSSMTAGGVLTAAGAGVAALGTLTVALKLGPKWAMRIVSKLGRFV